MDSVNMDMIDKWLESVKDDTSLRKIQLVKQKLTMYIIFIFELFEQLFCLASDIKN